MLRGRIIKLTLSRLKDILKKISITYAAISLQKTFVELYRIFIISMYTQIITNKGVYYYGDETEKEGFNRVPAQIYCISSYGS